MEKISAPSGAELRSRSGGGRREHGARAVGKGRGSPNYELRITNYDLDVRALTRGDAERKRSGIFKHRVSLMRKRRELRHAIVSALLPSYTVHRPSYMF